MSTDPGLTLEVVLRSAEAGDPDAQCRMGDLYRTGGGVAKQDYAEAIRWYRLAAAQGHTAALSELGTMFRYGWGVEQCIASAAEMYVIAALEGHPTALANLADYHDHIEADAMDGSLLCALCLGKMYDRGLGVRRDKARMFAWLLWGEERGSRDDDADIHQELSDMRGFYGLTLSDDIKDQASALFNAMRAATPRVDGTKSGRRRTGSPHQKRGVTPKPAAGGR